MPATPARIGFVMRDQRIVQASSATMAARYGEIARDPKDEPFETFFDSAADAQTMANQRLALVGTERRRFQTVVVGEIELDFSPVTPAVTLIDDEREANLPCLIAAITENAADNTTVLMPWG